MGNTTADPGVALLGLGRDKEPAGVGEAQHLPAAPVSVGSSASLMPCKSFSEKGLPSLGLPQYLPHRMLSSMCPVRLCHPPIHCSSQRAHICALSPGPGEVEGAHRMVHL